MRLLTQVSSFLWSLFCCCLCIVARPMLALMRGRLAGKGRKSFRNPSLPSCPDEEVN